MAHLCLLVAITFYPQFVADPWPLSQQWAILPAHGVPTLIYALKNTSSRYGEIDRVWPIPYGYCKSEGFDD